MASLFITPDLVPKSAAMSDHKPVVFVIDDDVSVRESLELLILSQGWQPETFATASDFLAQPPPDTPSCLILDITLPDLNGLELQESLAGREDLPIIFITGYGDIPMSVHAIKAGAVEFLTKPFGDEIILGAIRTALECSNLARQRSTEMQALRACYDSLSQREQQVMNLVVSGLLNKQVAGELGISEITVKAHRGRVMRKMEARSLAHLVTKAAKLGLNSPLNS